MFGRKRALRDLDDFGARFEEWLRTGKPELRAELVASLPKLRHLLDRAATGGIWYFETTLEKQDGKFVQDARDSLMQARGAYRDGVVGRPKRSDGDQAPGARWRETIQTHPIMIALGLLFAGFLAGFAARDALDRWLPWRPDRHAPTVTAPNSAHPPP